MISRAKYPHEIIHQHHGAMGVVSLSQRIPCRVWSPSNPVLEEPSADMLELQLYKTPDRELRGLVVDQDIYWWEAAKGTHYGMAKLLGVFYKVENRLHLYVKYDETRLTNCDPWTLDMMLANPQLHRLMQSSNILFDGGSYGFVTGKELIASAAD